MVTDRNDHFWMGGSNGVIERWPDGRIRRFSTRDGLPDAFVRALWIDHDGNVWAGTNLGLARLSGDRWVTLNDDDSSRDLVRCLFEDREGDLWVGSNSGLTRFRDTMFVAYGKSEGLPSDEPNAVFQDHAGRIWVGFHDSGLMLLSGGQTAGLHHPRRPAEQRNLLDSRSRQRRPVDRRARRHGPDA